MQVGQGSRHKHIDPAQQMVLRNAIIEAELIEQLALVPPPPPHHCRIPRRRSLQQTESPFGPALNAFIDSIGQIEKKHSCLAMSALRLKRDYFCLSTIHTITPSHHQPTAHSHGAAVKFLSKELLSE
jgi:hypothetical protein